MISRDQAAEIRHKILVVRRPLRAVASAYGLTASQVIRIVEGELVPVSQERFVIEPDYTVRSRKMTAHQRRECAHLICFGATTRYLADKYGVQIRAIQHIKKRFTQTTDPTAQAARKNPAKHLSANVVAESRYEHYMRGQSISKLAAKLFVSYRALSYAMMFKTHVPSHGRIPKNRLSFADKHEKQAFWLHIYGATKDFIQEATGVEPDRVDELAVINSEVLQ